MNQTSFEKTSYKENIAKRDAYLSEVLDAVEKNIPEYDLESVNYGFRRGWELAKKHMKDTLTGI